MSLPSADTADLWMRKNIAEVTDPETGAKSYEADEAYMRTNAAKAEITADFEGWFETASKWNPMQPDSTQPEITADTESERIAILESEVKILKAENTAINKEIKAVKKENATLAEELQATKSILGVK